MAVETKTYIAKIKDLIPNDKNPRQISRKAFDALKKSLKDFPEMESIREVIIDENNLVLAGHQRLKALESLGETTVPVKQVFGLTEKQKEEFIIKDNVQQGEWDMDVLTAEWDTDALVDWGLDANWLAKYTDFGDDIDDEGIGETKKFESVLRFSNKEIPMTIEEEMALKDLLDRYVSENQVAFGFVDWICTKCSEE